MSLSTENLQKHIETLEEKRTSVFFNMHTLTAYLAERLYTYDLFVGVAGIAIFAINRIVPDTHSMYFLQWSTVCALAATVLALFHYLFTLDKFSTRIHRDVCDLYKTYDDEYYILKKYTMGHIDEPMIRQFYVGKSTDTQRRPCTMLQPNIISWIATAFLFTALILALIA